MKMKKNKIKAFTLIELLTAMIVSAIVLVLGYNTLGYFQKNYAQFSNASQKEFKLNKMYTSINQLAFDADSIISHHNDVVFMIGAEEIILEIDDQLMLINNDLVLDSVNIKNVEVNVFKIENTNKLKTFNFDFNYNDLDFDWTFNKD
jgi:prepilin-type N-terminal cleavage/methylation domain-containing protein